MKQFITFFCLLFLSSLAYAGPGNLMFQFALPSISMKPISEPDIGFKPIYRGNTHEYIKTEFRVKETLNFGFDSDLILPESYPLLKEYGAAMEEGVSSSTILIEGHTDNIGDNDYNEKLSRQRAESVKEFLTSFYDIAPSRIFVKGYGETMPLASNDTEVGRQQNRRVEFIRLQKTATEE